MKAIAALLGSVPPQARVTLKAATKVPVDAAANGDVLRALAGHGAAHLAGEGGLMKTVVLIGLLAAQAAAGPAPNNSFWGVGWFGDTVTFKDGGSNRGEGFQVTWGGQKGNAEERLQVWAARPTVAGAAVRLRCRRQGAGRGPCGTGRERGPAHRHLAAGPR